MSAELSFGFFEHPHARLHDAERQVEHAVHEAGSAEQYTNQVEALYRQSYAEKAELARMDRMATFYTNGLLLHSSPIDRMTAASAFKTGELLAHGMLYALNGGVSLPANLADAYWKREIEKNRPRLSQRPYSSQNPHTVPLVETPAQHQSRMYMLARTMLNELVGETKENPAHMATASRLLSNVGETELNERMALAGYHLIMREVLFPNQLAESTYHALDRVSVVPEVKPSKGSIALRDLIQLVDDFETPEEEVIPKHVFSSIREKAGKEMATFAHLFEGVKKGTFDATAITAALRYTEMELNAFNRLHNFIKKGEVLIVSGEYFGVKEVNKAEVYEVPKFDIVDLFTNAERVHGTFDGFHMVYVPSRYELSRGLKHLKHAANETPQLTVREFQYCPAVRIKLPTYVYQNTHSPDDYAVEFTDYIDIPLHYPSVLFQRLTAPFQAEG